MLLPSSGLFSGPGPSLWDLVGFPRCSLVYSATSPWELMGFSSCPSLGLATFPLGTQWASHLLLDLMRLLLGMVQLKGLVLEQI